MRRSKNYRRRLSFVVVGAFVATLVSPLAPMSPLGARDAAAASGIDTTATPLQMGQALAADPTVVTGGEYVARPPGGTPDAVASVPLAGFPTNGTTYALLTTGDANLAPTPNTSGSSGANDGGGNVRGNSDFDVTILRVDLNVPAGTNCMLGIDFRFLSEEYPEFVGSSYNDSFIAELDKSTWTTAGSTISAPDNFAFDPSGSPISINAAGVTSMTPAQSAGTTYDGATPLLSAATPVSPGPHSLYLSIFDQGDQIYDSAVMLDNLRFGTVANVATDCKPGAKPAANRPLIYIPGIAGSELIATKDSPAGGRKFVDSHGSDKTESYKQGEAIWLNGSKLEPLPQAFNDQEFLDLLRFDANGNPMFDDFAPSGKFVTTTVNVPIKGPQSSAPYGGVIPALTAGGYSLGDNLFIFAYDWRYNADHARADLESMIGQVLAQTGAADVDIMAHSMGTMVTRDYLLSGTSRAKVHSVVMLAPPNLGTVKGAYAVHQGVCLPDDKQGLESIGNCYISDRTLRYIYRTLPGGLDQAPSKAYFQVYNGRDAAHPVAFRDETVTPPAADWNALANYEKTPGPKDTNCGLSGCSDEAAVTAAAFNASVAFHDAQDDWYNHVSTPVAIMAGTGRCTIGQILKQPVFTVPYFGWKLGTRWDLRDIDGDGTVTRRSASLDDGQLAPNVTVYYRSQDHNGMGQNASVLADALSILRGSPPAKGSIGNGQTGVNCHQILVQSPMELQITDAQGKRLGGLDGTNDYHERPADDFLRLDDLKSATIYGGGTFRADLQGTAAGEASIKMRVVGVDQTLKVYGFNHVPVSPTTKGWFTFDTGNSTISALTLDPDGTGQHLQTVNPVVVTANADDDVPPTLTVQAPRPGQAVVGTFPIQWTAVKTSGSPVTQTYGYLDAGGSAPQKVSAPGNYSVGPGSHTLDLYAEDALENSATAHLDLTADGFEWKSPMSAAGVTANGNRTLPVKFTVTTPAGDFVKDSSCLVAIVDATGKAMETQPCQVNGNSGFYHNNFDTGGLAPGSYRVRVSFDSPALTGSFSAPLTKS